MNTLPKITSDSSDDPGAPAVLPQTTDQLTSAECWWRIGDATVLGLWMLITNFTIHYHEKWADEAQAWLIARDLPLSTIWFHELRYEGSPGLWHTILWIAQHVFHAPYGAIGYIGLAGATAGAALLIFKAPFPRYIRWPLAFTYFMVYQYAVIARPYKLLRSWPSPLPCFSRISTIPNAWWPCSSSWQISACTAQSSPAVSVSFI